MKKLLAFLLCLLMCLCFTSCGEETNTGETNNNNDNSIVEDVSSEATAPVMPSEPVSDWMRGKNAEFRVRICTTTDLYTYVHPNLKGNQYKVDDISKTYVYFLIEESFALKKKHKGIAFTIPVSSIDGYTSLKILTGLND